jgi:class 3 adenylate cyclase/predicted ATPase
MQCPGCRQVVEDSAAFCGACGARVRRVCEGCARANELANAYCVGCGRPLAAAGERPEHIAETTAAYGASERRHLTVMFCDLVDSTQLARHLDPEEFQELVGEYLEACSTAIGAYDGEIAQLLGDGVLAYFGYPQAHEDDPIRAVDAALAILDALPLLNVRLAEGAPTLARHPLGVRIGVHTGLVVVSEVGGQSHRERLAFGDTVNIAARIQAAARPDTVVISGATRALVRDAFAFEDLGPQALKGIADPVTLTRVVSAGGSRHRLERGPESELTPFVGRERELEVLRERWSEVVAGRGQIAQLEGEAGIGKSRLLRVLRGELADTPHLWLEGRCSSFHNRSAFYPLVQLLRRALGFAPDDATEARVAALERWIEVGGLDLEEAFPALARLLDLPIPDRYPQSEVHPEVERKRILDLVPRWVTGLASRVPIVLAFEDLHWSDPSTLELLETYLASDAPRPPVLLLLTYRPEFAARWERDEELSLRPLDAEQTTALAEHVARGKSLSHEIVALVVEKTDGVPLFVEELTKNLLESDLLVEEEGLYRRRGKELAIPSTLQGSLMARLDRLGNAKEVAQLAAVIGREFSVELVAAVSAWPRPALDRALDLLERSGIARRTGPTGAVWMFKHALIQDAAYQSLLRKDRRDYHGRIADALEERFPELVESEPEVVARHCEIAGRELRASAHYERAGLRAIARSAHVEASAQLQHGIDLLTNLESSAEHHLQELSLQTQLGMVLLATRGYANQEVERCNQRARALCREIGESSSQLMHSLGGLFLFHVTRGDLATASEVAGEYRRLAEDYGDSYFLQWAHLFSGMPLHYRGRWKPALAHFEQSIELYDRGWDTPAGIFVETDPGLASRCMAGQALWMLGWPDRGLARTREAVEIARVSNRSNNLAFALVFSATLHQWRGDRERAFADASEVVGIAEEHRFPMWLGNAKVFRGWAIVEKSGGEAALAEIVAGLSLLATTGARLTGPQILGLLGQVYTELGRFEEAAGAVKSGLRMAHDNGIEFWNAELHRLRGEIVLRRDPQSGGEAADCFRRAREVADAEGALSLALRSATSAARQLRGLGQLGEARAQLAEVHGQLHEGQATFDLREASARLAELSAAPRAGSPSA